MHVYLARRLLLVIPTLLGVSMVVFPLVRLLPGDAVTMLLQDYAYAKDADELRAQLGLDRPIYVQYVEWLGGVVRGDLGTSLRSKSPVADELAEPDPGHGRAGPARLLVGLVIAIPVGVLSAVRQDTWSDYLAGARPSACWRSRLLARHPGDHAAVGLVGVDAAAALHPPARRPGARTSAMSSCRRSSWVWRSPGR